MIKGFTRPTLSFVVSQLLRTRRLSRVSSLRRRSPLSACLDDTVECCQSATKMAEMVPANQGVVAPTHTPQSAEGTPIVDTSTSSDSAMVDVRGSVNLAQFNQLNQQVRIEKAQILQQQQNVVNLTAQPIQ